MKLILVLATCLGLALPAPLDPSDEVELVTPINTNRFKPDRGRFPIFVIRPRTHSFKGFDDILGRNFGLGFGRGGDDSPATKECSGMCAILRAVQAEFDSLEERMKVLMDRARGRKNEVDKDEDTESASPVVTYDEKVLPDGSVLKINRTVYNGGSDDGHGFIAYDSSIVTHDKDGDDDDDDDDDNMGDIIIDGNNHHKLTLL